jgi:hypothetical protein
MKNIKQSKSVFLVTRKTFVARLNSANKDLNYFFRSHPSLYSKECITWSHPELCSEYDSRKTIAGVYNQLRDPHTNKKPIFVENFDVYTKIPVGYFNSRAEAEKIKKLLPLCDIEEIELSKYNEKEY